MKIRLLALVIFAFSAQQLGAQQAKEDYAIGTWQFVLSGSTYQSGPAPRRSIRQWRAQPGGKVQFLHDGTNADGKDFHTEFLAAYDAIAVPFTGGTLYDSVALIWRNPWTVEQVFRLKGKVTVKAIRKISEDRNRMTIDSRGVKPDGTKFRNWIIYERVNANVTINRE